MKSSLAFVLTFSSVNAFSATMTVGTSTLRYHKSDIIAVTELGDAFLITNQRGAFCSVPKNKGNSLEDLRGLAAQSNTHIHCQKSGDGHSLVELSVEVYAD